MNIEELSKLCEDCGKLKESIYSNKIILKATKDQESAFYRMLDSFINRLKYHIEVYNDQEYVQKTIKVIEMLEETNERVHVTFLLDKMKENLNIVYMKYKDKSNIGRDNFVSAIEPTIFYPIRIICEKLYRGLNNTSYDESLDNFFRVKKI